MSWTVVGRGAGSRAAAGLPDPRHYLLIGVGLERLLCLLVMILTAAVAIPGTMHVAALPEIGAWAVVGTWSVVLALRGWFRVGVRARLAWSDPLLACVLTVVAAPL